VNKEPSETKTSKTEAAATSYKYVGDGGYLHGVPARDLTAEDLDALPDGVTKKDLEASGLYKKGGK